MTTANQLDDVVVIGAGLAGLTAAALLARSGYRVAVLERASTLGGRAATHDFDGFRLNIGPHALYRGGAGNAVLKDLGVTWKGEVPNPSGSYALHGGARHALPGGLVSLLTTGLFGVGAKIETGRVLAGIAGVDVSALHTTPLRTWVEEQAKHPVVRELLHALFRLSTYANAPQRLSAGTAIAQLQLALAKNVEYLDGGWQTLVDGVWAQAQTHGATIHTGEKVTGLDLGSDGRVRGVTLRDGTQRPARAVVIALPASAAAPLLPDSGTARYAATATPIHAACLDVALRCLPQPKARFAIGVDAPLYYSVHSAIARLAPEGGAVIHVARYLDETPPDPKTTERELEGVLDSLQPGWRELIVERRFLPSMVAASALATAVDGGLPGRPTVAVPSIDNLAIAGDWVGPTGWLVDASFASARDAAELLRARLRPTVAAA